MNLSVNPAVLRQLGLNVQEQANEYKNEVRNIYSTINDINSHWQGFDAKDFITQAESYQDIINTLGVVIEQYGQQLLVNAKDYEALINSNSDIAKQI